MTRVILDRVKKKNASWSTAYCFLDVDDIWGHSRSSQSIKIGKSDLIEIARLNRLLKRYRKSPTNNLWVAYKQQRNKVTALRRKGIKEFCSNATSNAKHHGEFWKK